MIRWLLPAAVLLTGSFLWADMVGKEAPSFRAGDMINGGHAKTLEDCKGEVVLVKFWGLK